MLNTPPTGLQQAVHTICQKYELLQGKNNEPSKELLAGISAICAEAALLPDVQECEVPVPNGQNHRGVILEILAPLEAMGIAVVHEANTKQASIRFSFYPRKVEEVARFLRLTAT